MSTTWYVDYTNGSNANDGLSFATRKQTIESCTPTAGDTVRVMASSDPTSIGNATWTNSSGTITVASGLTSNINLCETGWTPSTNVTASASTTFIKQGTRSSQMNISSSFTTGKVAYIATANTDYSAFNQISFWMRTNIGTLAAGTLQLHLCSDTTGDVTVNTINIPAINPVSTWHAITVDTGAALGNSIQSVAVYAASVPGAVNILLDNIIACLPSTSANSLTLTSLISKNETGEGWWGIQSINGTSVILDYNTATQVGTNPLYYGTTETVTTYKRDSILRSTTSSATALFTPGVSGSSGTPIVYSGGWNTTDMSTQTGYTFFDGRNCEGWFVVFPNGRNYCTVDRIGSVRHNAPCVISAVNTGNIVQNCYFSNCSSFGISNTGAYSYSIVNTVVNATGNYCISDQAGGNNTYSSVYLYNSGNTNAFELDGTNCIVKDAVIKTATTSFYLTFGTGHKLYNVNTYSGTTQTFNMQSGSTQTINAYNCSFGESTRVLFSQTGANNTLFSQKEGGTTDNHKIYTDGGTISSDTGADRRTASGIAWKLSPTSTSRSSVYPLDLKLASIACRANKQVTVSVYTKRDNTGITSILLCKGEQIAGVSNDVTATAVGSAGSYEKLTITFTPTEQGVVDITGRVYGGTTFNAWFDDMLISQG